LLIRVPLSELNDQLDKRDFQQIDRSVIVNLNAVAARAATSPASCSSAFATLHASCRSRDST
jgi:DNA-binding LytR/AlgR family response regulator